MLFPERGPARTCSLCHQSMRRPGIFMGTLSCNRTGKETRDHTVSANKQGINSVATRRGRTLSFNLDTRGIRNGPLSEGKTKDAYLLHSPHERGRFLFFLDAASDPPSWSGTATVLGPAGPGMALWGGWSWGLSTLGRFEGGR